VEQDFRQEHANLGQGGRVGAHRPDLPGRLLGIVQPPHPEQRLGMAA
jgi:hypothetical protein